MIRHYAFRWKVWHDLNIDLPGWLGFLGFWAVFGEMTDFLTIVTVGPGGRVSFGI